MKMITCLAFVLALSAPVNAAETFYDFYKSVKINSVSVDSQNQRAYVFLTGLGATIPADKDNPSRMPSFPTKFISKVYNQVGMVDLEKNKVLYDSALSILLQQGSHSELNPVSVYAVITQTDKGPFLRLLSVENTEAK